MKGQNYIAGEWQKQSGSAFSSHDSATGEAIWTGASSEKSEVDSAVAAAREALPSWRRLSPENRCASVKQFIDSLDRYAPALVTAISQEVGKPPWEAISEVNAMVGKVEISIDAARWRCGDLFQSAPDHKITTTHRPHGVVAVFGPFNFPGHLPTGHIIPALLAGNTIVFKPSELTPLVGEILIRIWEAAGLPKGVVNLVQGGPETGKLLSSHPGIDGLFFTGSAATGLALSEQYGKTPEKILALELGGNNPLIVTDVEDLRSAALTTVISAFSTAGQRCTCARRLIVVENDPFIETVLEFVDGVQYGHHTDQPQPFLGPVISEHVQSHLIDIQEQLIDRGAIPLRPMQTGTRALLSPGILDVTGVSERTDEEYFGPLLQLIRVSNLQEAIEEANNTRFGLSASILTSKEDEFRTFYDLARAGIVNWNAPTNGASSRHPFGGIGLSGNHRPSAYYAADYCAYPVVSTEIPKLEMPKTIPHGITLKSS